MSVSNYTEILSETYNIRVVYNEDNCEVWYGYDVTQCATDTDLAYAIGFAFRHALECESKIDHINGSIDFS